MRLLTSTLCFALTFVLAFAESSSAVGPAPDTLASLLGIPADYPGLSSDGNGMVNVSLLQAKAAIHGYYKLNGFWPANWQAVVETGLCTAPLLTPFGQVITPDDQVASFDYDILFNPEGQSPPQLATFDESSGKFQYHELPVGSIPLSYIMLRAKAKVRPGGPAPQLLQYEGNEEMLRAITIGSVLQEMLLEAWRFSGHTVNSWDAFVSSGYFPHANDSVNPLTGKAWAADGMPGGLVFIPSPGGNTIPQLKLVDPNSGEHVWLLI